MTVGPGTFAVFIFMLVSIIIIFFRHMTAFPNVMVALAIALPVIVFLIIYSSPTGDNVSDEQLPTSFYMIKAVIFTSLLLLLLLISFCALIARKLQTIKVRRMDSEVDGTMGNQNKLYNLTGYELQKQEGNEAENEGGDLEASLRHY